MVPIVLFFCSSNKIWCVSDSPIHTVRNAMVTIIINIIITVMYAFSFGRTIASRAWSVMIRTPTNGWSCNRHKILLRRDEFICRGARVVASKNTQTHITDVTIKYTIIDYENKLARLVKRRTNYTNAIHVISIRSHQNMKYVIVWIGQYLWMYRAIFFLRC